MRRRDSKKPVNARSAEAKPRPRGAARRIGILACIAVLLGIGGVLIWGRDSRRNVLLISLDTTRADHLGCYGDARGATPNLDALGAAGSIFLQYSTAVPLTLPAHATLFTGVYPFVHGVRDNGSFFLPPEATTLAERFRESGYRTGAVVAATVLNREFGLSQGFSEYRDMHDAVPAALTVDGLPPVERRGDQVCDIASGFLRANGSKPFYLFVHLFDAHDPYEAPPPYRDRFSDPYLAEIAYVDAQVGRLLSTLKELKLDRSTLVVVIGDHGEGKGQHGEHTHGPFVYDATMSAPLIVRRPDGVGAGRRISAQVRSVDVAPTILSWARLPLLPGAAGVDLSPLIAGAKEDLGLAAYGESFHSRFSYGYSQLRMLREGRWKYIHAPVKELYDIVADPGETQNLADAEPQRVAEMRLRMQKLIAAAPPSAGALGARQGISEQTARNLQALGYLTSETVSVGNENASELDLFAPSLPNPADHALDIQLMSQASTLLARGQIAEAERPLREILKDATAANPGPFRAYVLLGRVLDKLGRLEEAVDAFRAALSQNAEDAATLTDLGNALAGLRRYDDAVAAYQAATQIRPPLARAFLNLAMVLSSQGKWEEALPAAQQAVTLDSGSAKAHARHGVILLKLNRPAEAYQAIQRAAKLDPKNEEYQRALKDLGTALGRG